MSIFLSVGVLILATLILCCLCLKPGILMLFYHHAFGKNSQKRANYLSAYFILGSATAVGILLTVVFMLTVDSAILHWILTGVLVALGILYFLFYFRRGRGTELFLSRKQARSLVATAAAAKSPSDAFMLGAMAEIPELIFSLPVYVALAVGLNWLNDQILRTCLAIVAILCILAPLFITWGFLMGGRNLADLQRLRVKNKLFCRFFVAGCYFILAALLVGLEILL